MEIQLKLIAKDDKALLSNLEKKWQELYEQSSPNVFLNWAWIGTWLGSHTECCYLLEVIDEGRVVGLAILVKNERVYFRLFNVKQIYLHRTGQEKFDQTWIEFNDFLISNIYLQKHPDCRNAIMQLLKKELQIDEFIIGVSTDLVVKAFSYSFPMKETLSQESGSLVDLTVSESNYLQMLSRNTRSQLKRNEKKFEALGKIELHFASDCAEAIYYFHKAGDLHIKKWGEASGFNNPHFSKFHEQHIKSAFNNNNVNLVKVTAGNNTVGYVYNLLENKNVYFYLAGLNFELAPKLQPGLLVHKKLIEHYRANNFSSYDFMAGQARYKDSFSTGKYGMFYVAFRTNKTAFKILKLLKTGKKILKSITSHF